MLTNPASEGILIGKLHPLKLTYPLKMGLSKRKLIFQPSISRCYVSFREDRFILAKFKFFCQESVIYNLVPETFTLQLLFQLDESTFFHEKWVFHSPNIHLKTCLSEVPGKDIIFSILVGSLCNFLEGHHNSNRVC